MMLEGKIALVTGAGQGVGAGIAKALAKQGAAVAVNDLFEDRAAVTADAIKSEGGRAAVAAFDVCDYAAVKAGTEPAYWAGDGVHPTLAGHALMAETWRKVTGV